MRSKIPYARSRSKQLNLDLTVGTWTSSTGSPVNVPWTSRNRLISMNDWVTPGWRDIIAAGGVVNTPCTRTYEDVDISTDGFQRGTHIASGAWSQGSGVDITSERLQYTIPQEPRPSLSDQSDQWAKARADAIRNALKNIDRNPYDFMEDWLERKKTMDYIRTQAGRAESIVRDMRDYKHTLGKSVSTKSKTRRAIDPVMAGNKAWLEFRFALSPLVRSIQNAWEGFHTNPIRYKRGRATGKSKITFGAEKTWLGYYGGSSDVKASFYEALTNVVEFHCVLHWELKSNDPTFGWKYGMRLKDLPLGLWQIVPYSFVLDRFINMSAYFDAWTKFVDPNITIRYGSLANTSSASSLIKLVNWNQVGYSTSLNGNTVSRQSVSYDRKPYVPTAEDIMYLPPLKLDSLGDAIQTVDLCALSLSRVAKSLQSFKRK